MGEHVVVWAMRTGRITAARAGYWHGRVQSDPAAAGLIRAFEPVPVLARVAAAAAWSGEHDPYAHLFPPAPGSPHPVAASALDSGPICADDLYAAVYGDGGGDD